MTGKTSQLLAEEGVLASMLEATGDDGKVKKDFLVLPFGDPFYGRDGRGPWVHKDAAQSAKILATTRSFLGTTDMMADYDHQSFYAAEGKGIQAPASGWINSAALRVEEDGIHVTVAWTSEAEAEIASRKYRYISPYFMVDTATRQITRLVNIALTNTPNLDLPALAHQRGHSGEDPDMTKITLAAAALATALAIPADGMDEAKVLAAIGGLKDKADGAEAGLASVRTELKLADDATPEAVIASIQAKAEAGAPDPAKFVPIDALKAVQTELGDIRAERVIASVDAAIEGGKLMPAQRDWALALGKKDMGELNSFLANAPALDLGTAKIKGSPEPEKGKLSDEEKAICSMMGVSEADFLKSRDEEAL